MSDYKDILINYLEKKYPEEEFLLADGLELAFIGVKMRKKTKQLVACYDRDICLDILMKDGVGSYEDAFEYFEYNIAGAWVGDKTPMFV